MNLDKLVAVRGLSGLYKVVANRNNGLIVEDFETKKRRFVSSRAYHFTHLGSVTIYALNPDDVITLSDVFTAMLDKKESLPVVSPKASKEELHTYFAEIMPKYDKDSVYPSDMKKLVKWFNYLDERSVFDELEEEKTDKQETDKEEAENNENDGTDTTSDVVKVTENTEE